MDQYGLMIEANGERKASWDWGNIQDAVAKKALLTVKVAVDQKNKSYEFTMPSKEQAAEVAAAIKAGTVAAGDWDDEPDDEPPAD